MKKISYLACLYYLELSPSQDTQKKYYCEDGVANLAAFLTRGGEGYDATMEAAIASGKRICTLPAIKGELETKWDKARFVYDAGETYFELVKSYDEGKCDAVAIGDHDLLSSIQLNDELCKRNLVATTSLIIENVSLQ